MREISAQKPLLLQLNAWVLNAWVTVNAWALLRLHRKPRCRRGAGLLLFQKRRWKGLHRVLSPAGAKGDQAEAMKTVNAASLKRS